MSIVYCELCFTMAVEQIWRGLAIMYHNLVMEIECSTVGRKQRYLSTIVLFILAMALLFSMSCGDELSEVEGLVTGVEPRSAVEVKRFTVEDEEGNVFTFTTEGFIGFTTSHFREHMMLAEPVKVSYKKEGDTLIAAFIQDA